MANKGLIGRSVGLGVLAVSLLGMVIAAEAPVSAQDSDQHTLVQGNNMFAFDLYQQAVLSQDGNLIFSPFSVSQAFAMAVAGAKGQTEQEILDTMRYGLPQAPLHHAFQALTTELTGRELPDMAEGDRFELRVANALWGQQDYPFLQSFLDQLAMAYQGGLRLVNFIGDPDGAREVINDWIEEQTNDKIQDMIPEKVINPATRLVLVNAIYFNASWQHAFEEDQTRDEPFYLVDGSSTLVPTMVQQAEFGHADGDGFQAINLPYLGGDIAMLAVMPDEGTFSSFEADFDAAQFDTLRRRMENANVTLYMPRFETDTFLDLKELLMPLGMIMPFMEGGADFTGMFDPQQAGENLFIGNALHKAFIGVDESGTEATAATVIIMQAEAAMAPVPPVELRLDHPFIYLIYDRLTGSILFMGRVLDPGGAS